MTLDNVEILRPFRDATSEASPSVYFPGAIFTTMQNPAVDFSGLEGLADNKLARILSHHDHGSTLKRDFSPLGNGAHPYADIAVDENGPQVIGYVLASYINEWREGVERAVSEYGNGEVDVHEVLGKTPVVLFPGTGFLSGCRYDEAGYDSRDFSRYVAALFESKEAVAQYANTDGLNLVWGATMFPHRDLRDGPAETDSAYVDTIDRRFFEAVAPYTKILNMETMQNPDEIAAKLDRAREYGIRDVLVSVNVSGPDQLRDAYGPVVASEALQSLIQKYGPDILGALSINCSRDDDTRATLEVWSGIPDIERLAGGAYLNGDSGTGSHQAEADAMHHIACDSHDVLDSRIQAAKDINPNYHSINSTCCGIAPDYHGQLGYNMAVPVVQGLLAAKKAVPATILTPATATG